MRLQFTALAVAAMLAAAAPARAEAPLIGLAAPLGETTGLLGAQLRDGATIAARATGARLVVHDDECNAAGGRAAARAFAQQAVAVVVGFLCTEAIEAALPVLSEAGIATITPGVRTDALTDRRERTGFLVWRLAPRADAEAEAVASFLVRRWRSELFAIVDDGTIYGRDLSESFRLAAEMAGLQPVFVDTYRPQSDNQIGLVGRLRLAGASHVFVGGDRDDVAIMARDAAKLGYEVTLAGGEALRAAGEVPLAAGTLMVGLPEWAEIAGAPVLERFAAAGIAPDGYALPAHAAMEVAVQAAARAADEKRGVAAILAEGGPFATTLGEIAFDDKGDLTRNPFRLFRYDAIDFVPVE